MFNGNKTFGNSSFTSNDSIADKMDVGAIVVKSLVFVIAVTATLAGNILICVAMKRFRRLRTPTNILLCSLASTDLAMVVVMVVHAVTDVSGHWISSRTLCDFVATLGLVLAFISILHLAFLSIDKYVAIKIPLRYPLLVTRRRVYIAIMLIWSVPSIFLNLPVADYSFRSEVYGCAVSSKSTQLKITSYIFILVTVFVAIPFAIMLYTHAKVFCIALSHVKRMSTVEKRLYETSSAIDVSQTSLWGNTSRRPHTTLLLKREIKSAKTFALVISVFLFCYTPFFITGTYRKVVGREGVPHVATFITTWLAFANSFSNPLVYSLRYSPFKRAFKKLCCVRVFKTSRENYAFSTVFQQSKIGHLKRQKEKVNNVVQGSSIIFKKDDEVEKKND